jgi:hypothetical protein
VTARSDGHPGGAARPEHAGGANGSRPRRLGGTMGAAANRAGEWLRRTPEETVALQNAKAVLDGLDFYPRKVRIGRVRILHVPWLFRLPWFRRFHGYEMGPLILLKRPIGRTPHELIVHELCHVWQDQDHRLRMWWSYVAQGYAENPHEVEARAAAAAAAAQ